MGLADGSVVLPVSVLKNHATSGALLFGPPGTGKTLVGT
jgi:SpoVK/Ycf46/Vps4 family AAA+-type ATPase